jgi:hypothetical protein
MKEKHQDEDHFLRCLGESYFDQCHRYDLTVCSGRREGYAIPVCPNEAENVESYAKMLGERLKKMFGLSDSDFTKALELARQYDREVSKWRES